MQALLAEICLVIWSLLLMPRAECAIELPCTETGDIFGNLGSLQAYPRYLRYKNLNVFIVTV